ncbi:MAG: DNA adenine methylase [Nannocystaceae bacterium]|nr:DNA adenine methylase [bacterium]
MIKYLGSKRTLLPTLVGLLGEFPELSSVSDVFSGTSRVGHAFKGARWRVEANDHNAYAHTLATCYVQADRERWADEARALVDEFNALPGSPGYFTETFCERSRFFQPHNGARVDAIREAIAAKDLPPELEAVLLVSLMEAADRVDSTCGLQMAYVKKWAARAYKDLELRVPMMHPAVPHGPCRAHRLDAIEFATQVQTHVAYVDPPYNQHSYLSNYHIWESLVLWDKPEVYGVACKRVDCRERKSDFNSKRRHDDAFKAVIRRLRAPLVVVSFNNEGYQSREQMEATLSEHGALFVIAKDFKRYVGAQIGIYNPSGNKVGDISHLRNEEYLYLLAKPCITDLVPGAIERLERFAARVDDPHAPTGDDRVSRVEAALQDGGARTLAELRSETGLSDYQARMAVESLLGRGRVQSLPGRSKRYQLVG